MSDAIEPGPTPGSFCSQDLIVLSAGQAVAAMRQGDFTAEQYAQTLLRRCERGAALNAFIALRPEQVLEDARRRDLERLAGDPLGPLHGLSIPIKDSVNTAHLPTTAGTAALRGSLPHQDAPLVRALCAAGAIVLGKTNLHELSYGYSCNNHVFGPVRNPYDQSRIAGGSSGGTAVAVASQMAPLGIAEDTEGSIRVPAALCGIVGFRPSTGRYPTEGCVPITSLFDQVGPHARTVSDLLLFDNVLAGDSPVQTPSLEGLRLGVVRSYFYARLDPEVARVCDAALDRLRRHGVRLVEGELPDLSRLIEICTRPVQYHDVCPSLSRYLAKHVTGVSLETLIEQSSPNVRRILQSVSMPGTPEYVSEQQYRDIIRRDLPAFRRMFRRYFSQTGVAAIVFPTVLVPAPPLGEDDAEIEVQGHRLTIDYAMSRNIAAGSTAGLPGLVMPAGISSTGLPISLEFDGPAGSDRQLLELGLALERALGGIPAPGI